MRKPRNTPRKAVATAMGMAAFTALTGSPARATNGPPSAFTISVFNMGIQTVGNNQWQDWVIAATRTDGFGTGLDAMDVVIDTAGTADLGIDVEKITGTGANTKYDANIDGGTFDSAGVNYALNGNSPAAPLFGDATGGTFIGIGTSELGNTSPGFTTDITNNPFVTQAGITGINSSGNGIVVAGKALVFVNANSGTSNVDPYGPIGGLFLPAHGGATLSTQFTNSGSVNSGSTGNALLNGAVTKLEMIVTESDPGQPAAGASGPIPIANVVVPVGASFSVSGEIAPSREAIASSFSTVIGSLPPPPPPPPSTLAISLTNSPANANNIGSLTIAGANGSYTVQTVQVAGTAQAKGSLSVSGYNPPNDEEFFGLKASGANSLSRLFTDLSNSFTTTGAAPIVEAPTGPAGAIFSSLGENVEIVAPTGPGSTSPSVLSYDISQYTSNGTVTISKISVGNFVPPPPPPPPSIVSISLTNSPANANNIGTLAIAGSNGTYTVQTIQVAGTAQAKGSLSVSGYNPLNDEEFFGLKASGANSLSQLFTDLSNSFTTTGAAPIVEAPTGAAGAIFAGLGENVEIVAPTGPGNTSPSVLSYDLSQYTSNGTVTISQISIGNFVLPPPPPSKLAVQLTGSQLAGTTNIGTLSVSSSSTAQTVVVAGAAQTAGNLAVSGFSPTSSVQYYGLLASGAISNSQLISDFNAQLQTSDPGAIAEAPIGTAGVIFSGLGENVELIFPMGANPNIDPAILSYDLSEYISNGAVTIGQITVLPQSLVPPPKLAIRLTGSPLLNTANIGTLAMNGRVTQSIAVTGAGGVAGNLAICGVSPIQAPEYVGLQISGTLSLNQLINDLDVALQSDNSGAMAETPTGTAGAIFAGLGENVEIAFPNGIDPSIVPQIFSFDLSQYDPNGPTTVSEITVYAQPGAVFVPEPAAFSLLALGGATLIGRRRRTNKSLDGRLPPAGK